MVRWRESVAYMAGHGVVRFFEIGAGKVLSGLVKRIADGAVGISVGGPNDIAPAKDALAAAQLQLARALNLQEEEFDGIGCPRENRRGGCRL